jgi:GNAT superfamily N-acetyltransferase
VGVASGGRLRVPDPAVRTLRAMWVDAEHRGQRVADALVGAVAAWARADGARVLTLWALDASTRAHAFYRRVGFSPVGADQDDRASTHPAMTRYTLAL